MDNAYKLDVPRKKALLPVQDNTLIQQVGKDGAAS